MHSSHDGRNEKKTRSNIDLRAGHRFIDPNHDAGLRERTAKCVVDAKEASAPLIGNRAPRNEECEALKLVVLFARTNPKPCGLVSAAIRVRRISARLRDAAKQERKGFAGRGDRAPRLRTNAFVHVP